MFRCYFCGQVTPPKTTRHNVVIEMREKSYAARGRAPKRRGFRDRDESVTDRGGRGIEITKEVAACPECAGKQHEVTVVEPIADQKESARQRPQASEASTQSNNG